MALKSDTLQGGAKREPIHFKRETGKKIAKERTKKNPAEIEDAEANIKAVASKHCLIDKHTLAPGDTVDVTEDELKAHPWLAKVALLIALLTLLCTGAQAQTYNANQLIPANTNNPWYSPTIGAIPDFIAGGTEVTNGFPGGATNTAVFGTNLVSLVKYDQIVCQITFNQLGGASVGTATNYVFLYPSADGVNVDTNHPVATFSVPTVASTNGILVTNLNNTVIGSIGYVQAGVGSPTGGNTTTNLTIQFFGKPKRNG
jgi:hypothetical protein